MDSPWSPAEKCAKYARFMSKNTRVEAEAIYWLCLGIIIIVLILTSASYNHSSREYEAYAKERDAESCCSSSLLLEKESAHRGAAMACFFVSCSFLVIASTCVGMQCLAMNNLQFCSGEEFMYFYSSTLGMVAIGGTIAIFGVCVHQFFGLRDLKHPVWAVGLGTPVSLICAMAHYLTQLPRWNLGTFWVRKGEKVEGEGIELTSVCRKSIAKTTRTGSICSCAPAPLIALGNGRVIQFFEGEGEIPAGAMLLGTDSNGYRILEFSTVASTSSNNQSSTSLPSSSNTCAENSSANKTKTESVEENLEIDLGVPAQKMAGAKAQRPPLENRLRRGTGRFLC